MYWTISLLEFGELLVERFVSLRTCKLLFLRLTLLCAICENERVIRVVVRPTSIIYLLANPNYSSNQQNKILNPVTCCVAIIQGKKI